MANEINLGLNLIIENGNFKDSINESIIVDQTGIGGGNPGKIDVGTAVEAISLGDIGSAGICYLKNINGTNFVEYGAQVGTSLTLTPLGRLNPGGEPHILRLSPNTTLLAQADTASCGIVIKVYEK